MHLREDGAFFLPERSPPASVFFFFFSISPNVSPRGFYLLWPTLSFLLLFFQANLDLIENQSPAPPFQVFMASKASLSNPSVFEVFFYWIRPANRYAVVGHMRAFLVWRSVMWCMFEPVRDRLYDYFVFFRPVHRWSYKSFPGSRLVMWEVTKRFRGQSWSFPIDRALLQSSLRAKEIDQLTLSVCAVCAVSGRLGWIRLALWNSCIFLCVSPRICLCRVISCSVSCSNVVNLCFDCRNLLHCGICFF